MSTHNEILVSENNYSVALVNQSRDFDAAYKIDEFHRVKELYTSLDEFFYSIGYDDDQAAALAWDASAAIEKNGFYLVNGISCGLEKETGAEFDIGALMVKGNALYALGWY